MTDETIFTKETLDKMDPAAATNVLLKASKIEGTVVVRRADGSIKYDSNAVPGTYGEEFLKARD